MKKKFGKKGIIVVLLLAVFGISMYCQWFSIDGIGRAVKKEIYSMAKSVTLHCYKRTNLISYALAKQNEEPDYLAESEGWFPMDELSEETTVYVEGKEQQEQQKQEEHQEGQDNKKEYVDTSASVKTMYSKSQLQNFDFMKQSLYVISGATFMNQGDFDLYELSKKDLSIKQDNSKPQILIYHTHSQEAFKDSVKGDIRTGIVGVGDYLTELLEGYGYKVIHDRGCYDLVNGVLDRNLAYEYSRIAVEKQLKKNPSIEVMIDLHRDGVSEDLHLVTDINGKKTAQIMFFNGLSRIRGKGELSTLYNKNLDTNMAMSLQMKLAAMAEYPGFTRKNYLNAYKYNLDLLPKAMLIEAGAQTNTFEEEKNAMIPLADLLHKILK